MKLKIEYKKINDLLPYENNSRTHSPEQVKQIAASIEQFGWTNPVLIDGDNGIIAGHGRLAAARLLDLLEIPTIELKDLTDEQKRALVIADNKLALNAGWDSELLAEEIKGLQTDGFDINILGFDEKELSQLFADEVEKEDGEIKFSEEIQEMHNYVVLYFDNELDWLGAQTHFNLDSVYSKRANGKPWSKGIGRVIHGGNYLSKLSRGK